MRRTSIPLLAAVLAVFGAPNPPAAAQLVSPAPGAEFPAGYLQTLRSDPGAYRMRRAWIQQAARARAARRQLESPVPAIAPQATTGRLGDGNANLQGATGAALPAAAATAVTGVHHVPVFLVKFANTVAEPYPPEQLQHELFGGGDATQTLADYYREISGGRIEVVGEVRGWHALPKDDTWYEGVSNGTNPADAHLGELLHSVLVTQDSDVDFGAYDNDGPDGIPNSGDDDGYVDFVAFVHPEQGGECGGNANIWSHRWTYSAWATGGGTPFATNDPSALGGTILIDDYTIQPALSCADSQSRIEIGVFCHEFGHAFGLPDLYDVNGGSAGLGHWCLMASGNWNQPASPAHMSAWAKRELGWVDVVQVGWQGAQITIPPVETSGLVYELAFTDDRWRRRTDCALNGTASLAVGLTEQESAARGWVSARGYGNGWRETIAHDFRFDGNGPVTLSYRYAIQSEELYDFAFAAVEVGGVESQIAVYDGTQSGVASFDITHLLGAGPTDYRVKFRFTSDIYFSNEDGHYTAACSPLCLDDVSVVGGGEHYSADFENNVGGWYQPADARDNPPSESWLVENRQAQGYDAPVHGAGLLVTHVDQEVADSGNGNSGGRLNRSTHGVAVEEADGLGQLAAGVNRGDAGDVFPGAAGKLAFGAEGTPDARSNSGAPTPISIVDIALDGQDVRAQLTAGDPAPLLGAVDPDTLESAAPDVVLELVGAQRVRHGVQVALTRSGGPTIVATQVDWVDQDIVSARFDLTAGSAGVYDVVVENPDGQTAVAVAALYVASGATGSPPLAALPEAFALAQNAPNPCNPATTIRFETPGAGHVRLDVLDVRGRVVRTLVDAELPAGYHDVRWNATDDRGVAVASGLYLYRMVAGGFVQQRKLMVLK